MKKIVSTFLLFALVFFNNLFCFAQTPYDAFVPETGSKKMLKLPDSKFKVTSKTLTGDSDYILFDSESHTLKYYSKGDSLIGEFGLTATDYKWLSIDPKAKKYPSHSPYNFVVNNPINAIDPDGRDVVFLVDRQGAGGNGHMGMLIQDKSGNWFHFSQGAAEVGNTAGLVSNSPYTGGVMVQPMLTKNTAGEVIQMTKEQAIAAVKTGQVDGNAYDSEITLKTSSQQDAQIFSNANKLQQAYEKKNEKYRLLTNNCVDAIQDVVQGDKGINTGISLPGDAFTPKPNSYYNILEKAVPWLNGDMKMFTPPSGLDNFHPQPTPAPTSPLTPETAPR